MNRRHENEGISGVELDALRPLLFSISYRMLSSVADAEDLVQEAFLRYQRAVAGGDEVESPKAYLSTVVTRLAIDRLRSAQQRRETYVGQWLPEPLLTIDEDPERLAEDLDSLSMAFLLVLERLNPVERAAFLLHDVFDYDYGEVSRIVAKSETNCRQLVSRARRRLRAERPRFEISRQRREEIASQFFAALHSGDTDALASTLAADVVVYGDGGGKAPQWSRPIRGAEPVRRLFTGLARRMAALEVTFEERQINGQPGAIFRDRDGGVINVLTLEIGDGGGGGDSAGGIRAIRSVINPDKLHHLGPVADAWALLRGSRAARPRGPAAGGGDAATHRPAPKRGRR